MNAIQYFLGLHPTIQVLIVSIFLNIVGVAIVLVIVVIAPSESKFFFGEKFRRGGAVLTDKNASGQVEFRHVLSDQGEGVLSNPNRTLYYFLPSLLDRLAKGGSEFLKKMFKDEIAEGEEDPFKDIVIPTKENIEQFNEVVKHRSILKGLRKPIFFGSSAKMIASNADLIEKLEESKEPIYKNLKLDKLKKIVLVKPWNIDTLVEMVNRSISPSDIDYIFQLGFLKGQGLKPKRSLAKLIIPIGLIIIGLMIFLVFTSGVQMPNFGVKA